MPVFFGRCHCGAVTVELHSDHDASSLPIRTCTCTYCSRMAPRYTADPGGLVRIAAAHADALRRYRFGLKLADYLSCSRCSVYLGAYEPGPPSLAVINVNVLENAADFTAAPRAMTFDGEDITTRQERRARSWTPTELSIAP